MTNPRSTGMSATTAGKLLVGAGVLKIHETDLGATADGGVFDPGLEMRFPEIAGQPGKVEGTGRVVRWEPTLTISALEVSQAIIDKLIMGASGIPAGNLIGTAAHEDVTFTMKKQEDKTLIITLKDAICTAFTLNGSNGKDDEGTIDITFEGCYTAGSDVPPYTIVADETP